MGRPIENRDPHPIYSINTVTHQEGDSQCPRPHGANAMVPHDYPLVGHLFTEVGDGGYP